MILPKIRGFRVQVRFVAATFLVVLAINGCSTRTTFISSDNAQAPAVATFPRQYQYGDMSAAVAWRGSEENGAEEANRIFSMSLPNPSTLPGPQLISPTSAGTGPVQLVRAGDRYFLGWIDNTEETAALLRWRILSASDLSVIDSGEWRANEDDADYSVSDFAAAYHPEEQIVLVALLKRGPTPPGGFRECITEEGREGCNLVLLPIYVGDTQVQVQEVEVTPEATTVHYLGYVRGVNVAAGSNGFLVTFIMNPYGAYHLSGNHVAVMTLDVSGIRRHSENGFIITGKIDCADDLQTIIPEGEDLLGLALDWRSAHFTKTAVAYDTTNDRYLVGYTTACGDSGYFRGRFVEEVDNGVIISGIAEGAYTTGGGDLKQVLEPPISISETALSPASVPMLAYNETLNSFRAGFGAPQNIQTLSRKMLYTRFLDEDGNPITNSIPVLEDTEDSAWGGVYPSFVTGNIVADPEEGKYYLVWEQINKNVPCENRATVKEPCILDWNDVSTSRKSKVYFKYFD